MSYTKQIYLKGGCTRFEVEHISCNLLLENGFQNVHFTCFGGKVRICEYFKYLEGKALILKTYLFHLISYLKVGCTKHSVYEIRNHNFLIIVCNHSTSLHQDQSVVLLPILHRLMNVELKMLDNVTKPTSWPIFVIHFVR